MLSNLRYSVGWDIDAKLRGFKATNGAFGVLFFLVEVEAANSLISSRGNGCRWRANLIGSSNRLSSPLHYDIRPSIDEKFRRVHTILGDLLAT